jgi:hypothetical protein
MRCPAILLAALLLASCGKPAEEKKAESDLNDEIMNIHRYSMAAMQKAGKINDSLDNALSQVVSVSSPHQGRGLDSIAAGLRMGKAALSRANDSMEEWMQDYRPYDPSESHEKAMTDLRKQKESLSRSTAGTLAAIDTASAALAEYRAFRARQGRNAGSRH